jgi:hypothetical protein
VNEKELNALLGDCPILYHMAELGSWPSIERNGLLSTSALLDAVGVVGAERARIEAQRRPTNVTLTGGKFGRVVVRDQKPIDDAGLARCLEDGLTPEQWYRLLNGKVFFWLTESRLHRLLGAGAYRELSHDVLELDSAPLVAAYRDAITLSPMNSGCTKPMPHPRGQQTFLRIEAYPYAHWRTRRKRGERVVELAVNEGVRDVRKYVKRVREMRGTSVIRTIYEK